MITLRAYQQIHFTTLLAILRERRAAHDGSDTGVGKTYVGAAIAAELKREALVVCPLSVCAVWRSVMEDAGAAATVINYESCWRKMGSVRPWGKGSFFEFTKKWPLVIFDEAHRVAGETTLNSKMAIAAKRQCGMVLTLSATAASSVMKMKALGFILGLHGLANYREWLFGHGVRETEFELKKTRRMVNKLTITKDADRLALTRLHDQIFAGGRGSRMRIADIEDFPSTQIDVRLLADPPKEAVRLSNELQAFYADRNRRAQFSDDELAQLVFWRQAAETAKIPYLIDMAEDALETSRVAVFCNFNRTVDELVAAAEKRDWTCGVIRGGQKPSDRQEAVEAFQANRLDLIVCNIQAGGVGVSLHDPVTKVPRTALICPTWSAVDLKQATGRVHRDGGGVSRQFIICFDCGIEKNVARAMNRKLDNLALLNDRELADGTGDEPSLALGGVAP